MHELSIAQSLLDAALTTAAEHEARRISTIRLRIGGMRQVVEESLRQAFTVLAAGSLAEHADVEIEWVPSLWRCARCGSTHTLNAGARTCACGSDELTFEGSDDLLLTSLDLECDDED